jgi:hypothetical protein
VALSASSGGYVSTAWLDAREWSLLEHFMKLTGIRRYAEAVRSAIFTAVVEVAQGRGLPLGDVEIPHSAPPAFTPQMGRRREVAVRLPAAAPVDRLKKFLKEALKIQPSLGVVVVYALKTALRVLTQRPAGLPPQARELLRMALVNASRAPRSELRKALLSELAVRRGTAERIARETGQPVDRWWDAIMREVERAADPAAAVRRYIDGEVPPLLAGGDAWRELWGKVLEDCRGDPQLLAKKIWLWREPLKRKAPGRAERGLVDYVCKLAESNPQSALDLVRALAEGRRVEVRAVERREEDFCARGLQWFEALGHAVGRAYRDARDRGAELHEAVLAIGDLIERYAKWRRRADLSSCPEVAERLAEAYREYREFQKFVGVDYGRRGSIEDDPHVLGGSDLLIRWRGLNQKLGEAAFQLLFHFSISKRGLYGEGEGPLDTGHRGDVRQSQGQNP